MSAMPVADNQSSTAKSRKNKKKRSKQKDTLPEAESLGVHGQDREGVYEEGDNDSDHSPLEPDNAAHDPDTQVKDAEIQRSSVDDSKTPVRKDLTNGTVTVGGSSNTPKSSSDTEERLEAASQERDRLKAEVTKLRKSLEELQLRHSNKDAADSEDNAEHEETSHLQSEISELRDSLQNIRQQHDEELTSVKSQLEQTRLGKDHADTKYHKLLGQVNTIKTQLGERLKADADELSQARNQIEDLEEENKNIKKENEFLQSKISTTRDEQEKEIGELRDEVSELRNRTNNSQKNWAKERDDLTSREAQVREELDVARQAMQDWEVLAMEERSLREGAADRVTELEEQLADQRAAHDRAASERDTQSVTVDGLQRALQEIQDARKAELREVVENTQLQVEELRKQLKTAEESAHSAQATLETTKAELERAIPFEREVKEKNLLIGKLRHEAVILNDHLTKALRFLKKGKPQDNVDRQLVTNHLLHFLALDRSDPKKFQVLQLISALLGWTEEQNEQAGLARPGASTQIINPAQNSTLRVPFAPFRRVSSSTSLNSPRSPSMNLNNVFNNPSLSPSSMDPNAIDSPVGQRSDSLAELWSSFLEREAQEGTRSVRGHSRRTSVNSTITNSSTLPRMGHGDRDRDKGKQRMIREDGAEGDADANGEADGED